MTKESMYMLDDEDKKSVIMSLEERLYSDAYPQLSGEETVRLINLVDRIKNANLVMVLLVEIEGE